MMEATQKETPKPDDQAKGPLRVFDLTPHPGEMIKPAETIDIVGHEPLTLYDRQVFNKLLANAHGPKLAVAETEFEIPLNALRGAHNSNERIEESIERLMKTVVRYRRGEMVRRFQLLGGNDMGDSTRTHGMLRYSFDKRLVEVVQDSTTFAKLRLDVVAAFSSKYALALYEYGARRIHLKHKWQQEHTVEEVRQILGVPETALKAFGNLKQKALDPAAKEVNALADFNMWISYKREGRKVVSVLIGWHMKSAADRKAAFDELQRSRVGRKQRINGTAEEVVIEALPLQLPELSVDLVKDGRI